MSKRTFDNLFLVQEFILVAEYLPSMYPPKIKLEVEGHGTWHKKTGCIPPVTSLGFSFIFFLFFFLKICFIYCI